MTSVLQFNGQAALATLPSVCPAHYVKTFGFDSPGLLADVLRSNGPSMGGFADGAGIFAQGNEYTTYDARGVAGTSRNWAANPDFPWAGGFKPVYISSDGQLVMRAGTAVAAGIDAQMPYITTGARYANYGSALNTWDSWNWQGDFCLVIVATLPSTVGSWIAIWPFTKRRTILLPDIAGAEIDAVEYAPGTLALSKTLSTNLHGNTAPGPGNPYLSTSTETNTGNVIGGTEHTFTTTRVGDVVTWYIDNTQIQQVTFPSNYVAKDDVWYLRINVDVADATFNSSNGGYPGIYTGGTDPIELKLRSIDMYQPITGLPAKAVCNNINDQMGPDRVVGLPNTGGISPGFFGDNGSSTTNGTAVGGITPALVASTGATWNRRYYYGKAATPNTGNPFDESGTTPANGGFVSGKSYRTRLTFDYGTSASGYARIESNAGGTVIEVTIAGTTVTPVGGGGAVTSSRIFTDSAGRKVLEVVHTADRTDDSTIGLGPNSATSGQTIIWYDCESRLILP